jgi:hypothetical protein
MSVNVEALPRVGLIVPPAHGSVPADGSILYPGRAGDLPNGHIA